MAECPRLFFFRRLLATDLCAGPRRLDSLRWRFAEASPNRRSVAKTVQGRMDSTAQEVIAHCRRPVAYKLIHAITFVWMIRRRR
jgi:hypothetical protein